MTPESSSIPTRRNSQVPTSLGVISVMSLPERFLSESAARARASAGKSAVAGRWFLMSVL